MSMDIARREQFHRAPAGKSVMWRATADYPYDGLPALASAYRIGSAAVQQRVNRAR
jgi:hypothetical protein